MPSAELEQAAEAVTNLPKDPGQDTKLRLYALYKQATTGDVRGERPGFMDFAGRMKYDAWAKQKGKSQDEAETEYIALVNELTG
ncbi:MAG: acyl-CoA-binding protein [Austwickia sp.]|jgi:diazepam-binding inhibitor (GABA receptor modulator, acyl-CoA-binding protein)|nr:acyl-CoA-binding protein [Austwickia sp.]MBK8435484.1 acyl-CoA-binding protein [Austwickia sp.]MBK9100967.1 acyl-CoA-binding protein [Austwickia sp.]